MLYPSVNKLELVTKSRYSLVILTAKRARQIAKEEEKNPANEKGISREKALRQAIYEISEGKVVGKAGEE